MENAWGDEVVCGGCKFCHVISGWCARMGLHVDPQDEGCRKYEGRRA
jgi:hypothetical protein